MEYFWDFMLTRIKMSSLTFPKKDLDMDGGEI